MSEIEVDEVLGLMGNVGSEVSSYDAVPGWVVLLVEFFLDKSGNILLNIEFLKGQGYKVQD